MFVFVFVFALLEKRLLFPVFPNERFEFIFPVLEFPNIPLLAFAALLLLLNNDNPAPKLLLVLLLANMLLEAPNNLDKR